MEKSSNEEVMFPRGLTAHSEDLEALFALKLLSEALLCISFTSTATDSLNVYGQTRRGCRPGRESTRKCVRPAAGKSRSGSGSFEEKEFE